MLKYKIRLGVIFLLVCLLSGCLTAGKSGPVIPEEYSGYGEDVSFGGAMGKAKIDAVRKAVIALIGESTEIANKEKLENSLYSTSNPNAFIDKDTQKVTRKDRSNDSGNYIVELTIKVKLEAIRSVLRSIGLLNTGEDCKLTENTNNTINNSNKNNSTNNTENTNTNLLNTTKEDWGTNSPDEQKLIRKMVENLTYMVYFNEKSGNNTFLMKTAVTKANEFLAGKGVETIDAAEIEKVKKDQKLVYEEQSGQEMSLIQWVAQKLNADVYIEIDAVTTSQELSGKYYGTVNLTLKIFEASTGRLLGSQTLSSPKAYSNQGEQDALINAMNSAIWKAMPLVFDQSRNYMVSALVKGMKYELIIQNTSDAKMMLQFRNKLKDRVKSIRVISQSPEETKYEVYLLGSLDDLADLIYKIAELVPGLEGIQQVLIRGKSATFSTGM